MTKRLIQQGDVVIKFIDAIPKGEREHDELTKRRTLALGEATGHHHTLDEVDGVEVFRVNTQLFLIVAKEAATLRHQEHNPIVIPPGKYEIGIVREADHFAGVIRQVAD